MATDVVMPQMGESIAEGTIVRWIKKVGDTVDRDEPLFEISTDKVDAEIPSPAAGVVTEIRAKEGETVAVNSVVAVIGAAGARAAAAPPAAEAPKAAAAPTPAPAAAAEPARAPAPPKPVEQVKARTSPLVRKIAQEHQVDISQIAGTGEGGRVTKQDILNFIGSPSRPAGASANAAASPPRTPVSPKPPQAAEAELPSEIKGLPIERPTFEGGAKTAVVPMSVMRKRIAEHMVASRRTSAHVHSVFEVNFARVAAVRRERRAEFERAGAKLTFMSFIARAVVKSLRAVPVVNASLDGENIVYHRDVNLGIAVALDWGLIVPVVKRADELNLLGLSHAIADLASRARTKKLSPDDVAGGTFTITNPGVFGAKFGMPIINQPQVAILGVGAIEKHVTVVDDAIAIRPMAYLTLGYDHRLIDGAVADQFMWHLKQTLENWTE
jgi:pyruvate dehydrogenase E2 component (dihydrolipoamide acetyltransferase)